MADPYTWRRVAHIPFIILLQIIFVVLFAKFVVYDEHSAIKNVHFDAGYHKEDATPEPQPEHDHADHDIHAEKLTDDPEHEKKPLHETTRDAKEILTDYPSRFKIPKTL